MWGCAVQPWPGTSLGNYPLINCSLYHKGHRPTVVVVGTWVGQKGRKEISLKWGCPRDSTSICLRLCVRFSAWQSTEFAPAGAKCGFRDWFNEGQRKVLSSVCWERQELTRYSRTRNTEPGTPPQPGTEPSSLLH